MDLDRRMADLEQRPVERLPDDFPFPRGESAVLLLVVVEERGPGLVLTRRAATLRTDPGFVALPGGRLEPAESAADGAIREATEEIGVDRAAITLHGRFDDAWSSAGFRVTPVVGTTAGPLELGVSGEVSETRLLPLADLAERRRRRQVTKVVDGHRYVDEVIDVDGWEIYGLTADLVLDLTTWLEGDDRRRMVDRRADLEHFAARRW